MARESLLARRGPAAFLASDPTVRGLEPAPPETALADFLGDWLRFQGALRVADLGAALGVESGAVESAVALLVAREAALVGELVAGAPGPWVAALTSYEALLRWRRAEARPAFTALPVEELPLFLADHQGLTGARTGLEGLQSAFERLFGWSAAAAAWEQEILPARVEPYQTAWLDALCEDGGLRWLGTGVERATFALEGDLALLRQEPAESDAGPEPGPPTDRATATPAWVADLRALLAAAPRGLELGELAERLGETTGDIARALWALAWRGEVANDSPRTLRQGILAGFEPPAATAPAPASRRSGFRRWAAARPFPGRWFALPAVAGADDALRAESLARERARVLLDRHGVVFRELAALEAPGFGWARLARPLRALELAGEIVAGHFFAGVPGLQFATPAALRRLREGLPGTALWWLCATDPASACGIDLPELKSALPRRVATTHLAFVGGALRFVSRRSGRELEFRSAPDDPINAELVAPLRSALVRAFAPLRAVEIETINGEPAAQSPYLAAFARFSVTREGASVRLRRRYAGGG